MFIGSKQLLIVLLLSEGFIFAMDKTRKQKNKEQKNDTREKYLVRRTFELMPLDDDFYQRTLSRDGNAHINKLFGTNLPV